MSLTGKVVMDYLVQVPSLSAINNHEVKDSNGCKTGQMPLTIQIGRQLIERLLEQNEEGQKKLSEQETTALIALCEALNGLPTSMDFKSLYSVITGLDIMQKKLLEAIDLYLKSISDFEEHRLLLKVVVLVLKILEYDLSKRPGPIRIGYSFFSMQVLSDEQRIGNHTTIFALLTGVIAEFDRFYEQKNHEQARAIAMT